MILVDFTNPDFRSRLVGRELRHKEVRDDTFAATPPLEALRFILSLCMTRRRFRRSLGGRKGLRKIRFLDASRAHFHATALRDIFVDLPEEDHEEGMCGKLLKTMYGTRDAAACWEAFYTDI